MFVSPKRPFEKLLGGLYTTKFCQLLSYRRYYVTAHLPVLPDAGAVSPGAQDVAIIGGGITGLASAWYLAKASPSTQVVLYESGSLGGWIRSEYVDVEDGRGKALFEYGPRTLRPAGVNGRATLDLIQELGLSSEVVFTPKDAPAARNRYIFYPDSIVRLPSPTDGIYSILQDLLTKPLLSGVLSSLALEYFKPKRHDSVLDESVGSFISRRFSPQIADNIVSAVFHGIYAGDIYSLSAKTVLKQLYELEGRRGSLAEAFLEKIINRREPSLIPMSELDLRDSYLSSPPPAEGLQKSSIYGFRRGIQALPLQLEKKLKAMPNVKIRKGTGVFSIVPSGDGKGIIIEAKGEHGVESNHHSSAICTVSSRQLVKMLVEPSEPSKSLILESLASYFELAPSVTVAVINLYFPPSPSGLPLHPYEGFGYLLPRTVPFELNPERALGVLFSSDALPDQDIGAAQKGTKMTIMMGGHWWNEWTSFPDEEEAVLMARRTLARHLNITDVPTHSRVTIQRDCIPQPEVGGWWQLKTLADELAKVYKGRLRVAGTSYSGPGVNDCVRSAWDVVHSLLHPDRANDYVAVRRKG